MSCHLIAYSVSELWAFREQATDQWGPGEGQELHEEGHDWESKKWQRCRPRRDGSQIDRTSESRKEPSSRQWCCSSSLSRHGRAAGSISIGLKHVLLKPIALKFSMRLKNEAFRLGILRHRQELGRTLNLNCLWRPSRLVDVVSCVELDYLLRETSPLSLLCWRHYHAPAAALLWTITPPPPPILSHFFPNFKCLWRPPRPVRSSSSSGYILPRSPPSCVLGWVFYFLSFLEKHTNVH